MPTSRGQIRQRTRQPIHGLEAEAAHLHQGISMMLNGIQRVKLILVAVAYQVVEHLWRNRRRCIAELCNDFPLKLRLFQSVISFVTILSVTPLTALS